MKYLLLATALFTLVSCKPGGQEKHPKEGLMNRAESIKKINTTLVHTLGFKAITCPPDMVPDPIRPGVDKFEIACFTSPLQPEDLLADLKTEIEKYGEVQMGWRQDFGRWVSTYTLSGGKFDLLVSLEPPYATSEEPEQPAYKGANTVARYIFGPSETAKK